MKHTSWKVGIAILKEFIFYGSKKHISIMQITLGKVWYYMT